MRRVISFVFFMGILSSCSLFFKRPKSLESNNNETSHSLEKSAQNLSAGDIAKSLSFPVKKIILNNGLQIFVVENHRLPIMAYYTFFTVGGRHERPGITGATHFLEHLMFKGTPKNPMGVMDGLIESSGGSSNAYTSFDQTVYHEAVAKSLLPQIMELEADRMTNSLVSLADFEKERKVILEERKMRYENSARGQIFLTTVQEIFAGTPYGGSVIGSLTDLHAVTYPQIQEHYKKFYVPNNAVIVVAGDVNFEDVKKLANQYYGVIPKGNDFKAIKEERDREELYQSKAITKRSMHIKAQTPTPIFMMSFLGRPMRTLSQIDIEVMSSMLSSGVSSYFQKKYVKSEKPLLNEVSSFHYSLAHQGAFIISGELIDPKDLKKVETMMTQEALTFCEKGLDERALLKTKNQMYTGVFKRTETNAEVAEFIGDYQSQYGDYEYYKKELSYLETLTLGQVKKTCHELFDKNQYVFITAWDKNK